MQLFERARRYGEAVRLLDEFLGDEVRDRVMERFSAIAAPMQRRKMKDPWEVIARSALDVGVPPGAVQALGLLYVSRTNQWKALPDAVKHPTEQVWQYLRDWQAVGEIERQMRLSDL